MPAASTTPTGLMATDSYRDLVREADAGQGVLPDASLALPPCVELRKHRAGRRLPTSLGFVQPTDFRGAKAPLRASVPVPITRQ